MATQLLTLRKQNRQHTVDPNEVARRMALDVFEFDRKEPVIDHLKWMLQSLDDPDCCWILCVALARLDESEIKRIRSQMPPEVAEAHDKLCVHRGERSSERKALEKKWLG